MGFEKVWNARLQQARKTSLKGKKILCAFNALVDLQEFVSCRQVENLLEKRADVGVILKRSKRVVTAVDSQADFLAALLHSMREGKALHITSGNPEVFTWLQLAFGPVDETRLGGQAGIIANQAALLGARSIVYSPIFSKELSKFFVKGVMFPVVERGKFFLVDAKKAGRDGDETKKNWIFEFSGGDTFSFGKYSFKIPRSNRFILASKMPVVPAFEASLRPALPIIGAKVGSIVFAGFHYLKPYYDKFSFEAVLQRQDADVRSLCKKNKDLVVHVEYVPMPYPEIAKGVLAHVAREAKSFGVNEVEVKEVLGFLGFERLARQIEENESAAAIYAGALVLL
ncbi:MAG: ADP-dependent glucokinase/phosphofructokinase, partial [Candidatus Micrarchaeia archaeon]